jgi:UDP-N-acetylglucosamine 2-epimerase (non-hydrolysing)
VTERPEGVDAGAVILVGTDPDRIRTLAVELLTDDARHESMASRGRGIYGDGRASERIVDRLLADLSAVP